MKTIKAIISETKKSWELRGLIEVYEEIAALRMQKIRQGIMQSREFYDGLARLSDDVGTDFSRVTTSLGKKSAAVFLSANTGLYGEIIDKTFVSFLDFIRQNRADVFIVGKLGEQMMASRVPEIKYQSLFFPDDKTDMLSFADLASQVLPYSKVFVFYGKFKNIAVQNPSEIRISGDLLPKTSVSARDLQKTRFEYLYEPSSEEVSSLFASEILASILEQTVRESQLAKFASRIMHLDRAIENVDESLLKLNAEKRKLKKKIMMKKQNIMVAGVMARA